MIQNGDSVFAGGNPTILFQALFETRERFQDVRLYSMFGVGGASAEYLHHADMLGHVSFACVNLVRAQKKLWPNENLDQISGHFSEVESLIEHRVQPAVTLMRGCPMDEEGFIYLGGHHGCARAAVDWGAKVAVQIDPNLSYVYTDHYRVHISEVDVLCEADNPVKDGKRMKAVGAVDEKIAALIAERIPNGATIQLGAGGVPNAVGMFLDHHRDLGVHTEVFIDAMAHLVQKGAVNNSKKTLLPGVSVAGFIDASPETHVFGHKNPGILLKKLAWVNSPMTIAQIYNLVSVNSCLEVDLRGQVCSESIGLSNTGGLGGQLDFVEGARKSPGGQSFLAMHAAMEKENGEKISKISLALPPGSVVSTPRSDVMYVATEYGVADLMYKSVKERARSLIGVADPDFRDKLTFEAKKHDLL
jgi:4-hydroxybutyrate CoA-transferase